MASNMNKFWDSKWVKIPLYFVSILGIFSTLENGLSKGEWPNEFQEIVIIILLGAYIIIDLLVIRENKIKARQKNDSKIDEIGKS